jgi:hypothetical protein
MHSMKMRRFVLTTAVCLSLIFGCVAPITTVPRDHTLSSKDESLVFGRVRLDLDTPPLAAFTSLTSMELTVKNEATGKDYVLVCDKTGLDSEFYGVLAPGPYRSVSIRSGNAIGPLPGRFELGPGQIQYLGTLRFRGVSILSLSRQYGSAHFFDKLMDKLTDTMGATTGTERWYAVDELEQAQKSLREKFPHISRPVIKSAMIAGAPIGIAASPQIGAGKRTTTEKLIGNIHRTAIAHSIKDSPDGRRAAYVAVSRGLLTEEKKFVVVDGKDEKEYDDISASMRTFFSPDGKRVAYGAKASNHWLMVVDGKEEGPYDGIVTGSLTFSSDSKRIGYAVAAGKKFFAIVDGKREKHYDVVAPGSITFSPDGKRVGYVAGISHKYFAVLDGVEQKHYDHIDYTSINFSPDSKRVGYIAKSDNGHFLVLDGIEEKRYDSLVAATFIFGADSRRVAYGAKVGSKEFAVVDGEEMKQYDSIGVGTLVFSPDSKRIAYGARVGSQWVLVVDGKEGKRYDGIGAGSVIFSPDSKRVAYCARVGNRWVLVVDGKEEKQYDAIGVATFSPDSRRVAYGAVEGNKSFVVSDEKEGARYDAIVSGGRTSGGKIIFDDPDHFRYSAIKGNGIYVIEEAIGP